MSTHLGKFYALKLGNHIHCMFISLFLCSCFLRLIDFNSMSTLPNVILCQEVREAQALNVHTYIFETLFLKIDLLIIMACQPA